MPPVRILHVHTDLRGGGIERALVTLATHTVADEVAVCWCPTNHPSPPAEFLEDLQEHVKLIRIPPPFLSLAYAFRLWRVIGSFRPTVLHLHGASVGIIGSVVGRLARVPAVIYTEHSEHGCHANWLRKARELTASLPHHTVCVSGHVRRSLLGLRAFRRIANRLSVIHNGIDLSPYRAVSSDERGAIRRELGIPEDARVIGSVGLLWHVKGYEYLVKAMPEIIRRCPQTVLALVGSGEDEATLRQMASDLSITSRVLLLGWRGDIPRILPAVDVYVQPSLSEALGLSILEAGATGLPIVATSVGGVPEVLADRENARLVAPGDEAALSDAIVDLLTNAAEAGRLGARVRGTVNEHYSAQAMSTAYAGLYRGILMAARGVDV